MIYVQAPRVLAACLALAIILHAMGCGRQSSATLAVTNHSTAQPVAAKPTESIDIQTPELGKADFALTAQAFFEEFKANSDQAKKKYDGKIVLLDGEVESFGRALGGDGFLLLKGDGKLEYIQCMTKDKEPWAKIARGQKVQVQGTFPMGEFRPGLIDAVIVKSGPPTVVSITAAALAKEFTAAKDETRKKYEKKHVVVEGEVVTISDPKETAPSVWLKGDGVTKIEFRFTSNDWEVVKPLKIGQTVKIIGDCDSLGRSEQDFVLHSSYLITK